jgi:hypothetical protein
MKRFPRLNRFIDLYLDPIINKFLLKPVKKTQKKVIYPSSTFSRVFKVLYKAFNTSNSFNLSSCSTLPHKHSVFSNREYPVPELLSVRVPFEYHELYVDHNNATKT